MANTICFSLQDATQESLEKIKKDIEEEINRRREMEKAKLVEKFKSAFMALYAAGIDVHCADCYDDIDFLIHSWDDFYFD